MLKKIFLSVFMFTSLSLSSAAISNEMTPEEKVTAKLFSLLHNEKFDFSNPEFVHHYKADIYPLFSKDEQKLLDSLWEKGLKDVKVIESESDELGKTIKNSRCWMGSYYGFCSFRSGETCIEYTAYPWCKEG
jgi:hypothetical protein